MTSVESVLWLNAGLVALRVAEARVANRASGAHASNADGMVRLLQVLGGVALLVFAIGGVL